MNLKGAKNLSMKGAVKIITDKKNRRRIMEVLFEKEDGTERVMKFRPMVNKGLGTGIINVKEQPANDIKSFNIQKVKGLVFDKVTHKLPYASKKSTVKS